MKNKTTILLDDSARAIAQRYSNVSQYLGRLMTRNWAQWRRALIDVQQAGMTNSDIEASCKALNGAWLVNDSAAVLLRGVRGVTASEAQQLEVLAWEYWHGNDELRSLLGAKRNGAAAAPVPAPGPEAQDDDDDDDQEAPPPKPKARPKKASATKAQKDKT